MLLAAARVPTTTSFWDWSVDLPLILVVIAAVLFCVGSRRTTASDSTARVRRWRTASFLGGLLVTAVALDSPIEALAARLFWVHMVQHVLLLTVAPPLIVLGRPWIRLWRPLPLGFRRALGRGLMYGSVGIAVRRIGAGLGSPLPTLVAFCGVLLAWHIPALFDATLRSVPLHALEHALFFGTALLFWKQVISSPPLRARLTEIQRIAYLTAAMVVSWILAIVLALAPHPLYGSYAHELGRPGGISALSDQQLAAGVMWVPGSIAFVVALLAYFHRWSAPATPQRSSARPADLIVDH
jgi:cytochrome c oxidase assembly factor CtaG